MDIVLIKPPQTYLFDPGRVPALGLMYIAAVAKNTGHHVQFIDFSAKTEEAESIVHLIPRADLYGMVVSILDYKFCNKLARLLKERADCVIVCGGAVATTAPEEIDFNVVDALVRGEGELSFQEILTDISQGKKLRKAYVSVPIERIDTIAFPLREGIKFMGSKILRTDSPTATIIMSRGCSYNCAFCASKTIWGRTLRFRSVENVLDEIDYLIDKYSIKGLQFLDDTAMFNQAHFQQLCYGLKERGMVWRCSTRSDLVTEECAKLMRDCGCVEVGIGVESADPDILQLMRKDENVEVHERAIKILKTQGLKVACFFITGLPGEKNDTPELTIAFIKRTNPDRVFCTTFMPYPGTPIWDNPASYKIKIISRDLSKYNQVSGIGEGGREFVAVPFGLTYEQLVNNRKRIIDFLAEQNKIAKG